MHLILKPLDVMRRWLPEPSLTKARYDTEGAWLSNCFSRVGEILQQVETHHNGNSKGAERVRHCMEKAGSLSGHTSPLAGEKIRGEGGVSYSGGGKEDGGVGGCLLMTTSFIAKWMVSLCLSCFGLLEQCV